MIDSEQKMYTTAFNLKLKSDHVTRQNSELEDMIKCTHHIVYGQLVINRSKQYVEKAEKFIDDYETLISECRQWMKDAQQFDTSILLHSDFTFRQHAF